MFKNKTIKLLFWPITYLVLIALICVLSTITFNNMYFSSVYVSGQSMNPTLIGVEGEGTYGDYGCVQKDSAALKNLKRYQIVTTLYPGEVKGKATSKIKRVLFMPGETFEIINNDLFLYKDDSVKQLPVEFDRKISNKHSYPKCTLGNNQYFVAGDNWDNSLDSFDVGPVTFDMLQGIVIKIEGQCKVRNGNECYDFKPRDKGVEYFYGVDY